MEERTSSCTAMVLDEGISFTLYEVCRSCGVHAEVIVEMIGEGIVTPKGSSMREWRFDGIAIRRAQQALRLQADLGVNLPGAALALELMEEIERLRRLALRTGAV